MAQISKTRKKLITLTSKLHVAIYQLMGGRIFNTYQGTPICLITMKGRKTGNIRTTPVMCIAREEKVILVASLAGTDKNPTWYYNLKANPEIEIQVGPLKRKMRAEQASSEEKNKLWPSLVEEFPIYGEYAKQTERDIPVFICSPIE